MNDISFSVQPLSKENIPELARIEQDTFAEPWSESALALLCTEAYPSFVAILPSGETVGYVGTLRTPCELQMINLAVKKEQRCKGIARSLLSALDRYCEFQKIPEISLEVRDSNTAAISLYLSCGYVEVGKRKNFYRFPSEDARIMIKTFEKN